MENFIQITIDRIKKDEPCVGNFQNHLIKGSVIGYGYNNRINPITGVEFEPPITLDIANEVLHYNLIQCNSVLIEEIGYSYIHMDDYRKSFLLNMTDLVGIDEIFIKLKSTVYAIFDSDFEMAADLVCKNFYYRDLIPQSRRLRNCINALRHGKSFN